MATDVERLIVSLEARTKAFENALNRANGTANKRARQIEKRFADMNKNISATFSNSLKNATALAGVGLSAREVIQYADAWTQAGNMIRAAAASAGVQVRTLEQLNAGANDARVSLTDYADLYARLIRSASGVAKSEEEIALATNLVSKAFKAGGASAQEQAAGILQLGQALGSGVLQGDELRSIRENAPIVAKAIADEFKVSISGLKQLGADGKLTSDRVFRAIINAQKGIEEQFRATNTTIGDSFTKLANNLTQYIGQANEAYGITATVGGIVNALADNIGLVANSAAAAAVVLLSQYVPAMARVAVAGAAMVATNPFLLLAAGIGAATFAVSAYGDEIRPIAGEMANLQDYASVAWEEIEIGATNAAEVTRDAMLSVINFISQMMDDTKTEWSDVGSFITNELDGVIAAFKGLVAETKVIFNELPSAVAEYVIDAMNAMIAGVESGMNKALNGINAVSKALNGVDKFLGFTPLLNENLSVDLGRIENTYRGAGKAASDAWNKALEAGRKRYFSEYLQDVRNKANARARQRTADAKDQDLIAPNNKPNTTGFGGGSGASADGDGGKKKRGRMERQNELQREIEQIKERTATLQAETAAQAQINPLIDDYDYAITKARATQELLNAAKKAGIEITPALKEQINGLAEGYAHATAEANKLAESQEQAREAADFFKNSMLDAFQSMVPTIETGNKALDKFLNTLIEAVIQATLLGKGPLAGLFGGGGLFKGGGLLGGAIIPGILHSGGVAGSDGYGHGRAVSPSAFSGAKRYHRGGIAGLQPGEIPAILQRGEVVLPRTAKMNAGSTETIHVVLQDDSGRMAQIADQRIQTASGAIVQVSVQQSAKAVQSNFPTMLADAQARKM
ncbi:tail length tape measure protein [Brucella phage BiPBO1]|uniref:tail length tape measure protein n=1 Tax=Brucella phage BiPBO1 TaxID=1718278 RepID=UPI0002E5D357|nr:tape measure protein [Brucella inopinata]YP_009304044.1 tail length tape measure protein [Brucella phage BiPBO1]ALJ98230.1 tail length tape measure protein [Brucella phage BiPBO1]